jgi:hypothetical protein
MLEELKKLLKERDEAYKEFRSKYDEKCDEVNNKILELLPYEGKLIKVQDDIFYNIPLYINVREVFKHGNKVVIRGYGFSSEFTEYVDDTWSDWTFMKSFEFDFDRIEQEIKKITIITETEFNRSFDQMINNMRYEHMKKML